ncbi:MAG: hypothetical protein PHT99_07545 [Methanoregula sp.]|nr:hypothetical protein [Methanoregula sp.]
MLDDNLLRTTESMPEDLYGDDVLHLPDHCRSPFNGGYPMAGKKTGHIHPE